MLGPQPGFAVCIGAAAVDLRLFGSIICYEET